MKQPRSAEPRADYEMQYTEAANCAELIDIYRQAIERTGERVAWSRDPRMGSRDAASSARRHRRFAQQGRAQTKKEKKNPGRSRWIARGSDRSRTRMRYRADD